MLITPRCAQRDCKHFIGVKQDDKSEEGERVVCFAFSEGIPDVISYGSNLHTKPFEGDNDILYEKRKE